MLTPASKFTIGPDKSKGWIYRMRYFENVEKKRFNAKELEVLIKAAQQKDAQAIEALCANYEGLLRRLCNNSAVRQALGYEDAVNTCYVYFLELIYCYQGDKYELFPGLVETVVGGRLKRQLHYAQRHGAYHASLEAYESQQEAPLTLLAPPTDFNSSLILEELLKPFPPLDRQVLELYFQGQPQIVIRQRLNLTESKVRWILRRAKKILKFS